MKRAWIVTAVAAAVLIVVVMPLLTWAAVHTADHVHRGAVRSRVTAPDLPRSPDGSGRHGYGGGMGGMGGGRGTMPGGGQLRDHLQQWRAYGTWAQCVLAQAQKATGPVDLTQACGKAPALPSSPATPGNPATPTPNG